MNTIHHYLRRGGDSGLILRTDTFTPAGGYSQARTTIPADEVVAWLTAMAADPQVKAVYCLGGGVSPPAPCAPAWIELPANHPISRTL